MAIYRQARKLLFQIAWLLYCTGGIVAVTPAQDPFRSFLHQVPPVLKTLGKDTIVQGDSAITLTRFLFASRNGINTVYAVMARPQQLPGKHPAILFLHGGGSRAEDLVHLVKQYARRGYVTLTLDLPGICNSEKAVYSGGPWKNRPAGEAPRFDMSGGPASSTLVDGEVAALEAFNLLAAQSDVDVQRMGITGFSWGGYSTTLLSGLLGKRVKAAYSVFGCGFYDKGSFWKELIGKMSEADRTTWLTYLDAGRRAAGIRCAFFLDVATNDTYFWPEAVSLTLQQIRKNKNHVWNPNLNHRQSAYGAGMQQQFFDYYLKNIGAPFGTISIGPVEPKPDGSRIAHLTVQLPEAVRADSVLLYYSDTHTAWQKRVWTPVIARKESEKLYQAIIPAQQELDFYGYLLDSRKITTASEMCFYGSRLTIK